MYASPPLVLKAEPAPFRLEHSAKQALQEGVHAVSEVPTNDVGFVNFGLASSSGDVGISRRHEVVQVLLVVVCRREDDAAGSTTVRREPGLEHLLSCVPVRVGPRDVGSVAQHALHERQSFGAAAPKHALEVFSDERGVTFVVLDVNIRLAK